MPDSINSSAVSFPILFILAIGSISACQSIADARDGNEPVNITQVLPVWHISWMLLAGGLALTMAGILYYAKGAIEGLREDELSGGPVIVKNGTMVAGQVLITTGIIGVVSAFFTMF